MPVKAPTHSAQLGRKQSDLAYAQQGKWGAERAVYKTARWRQLRKVVLAQQRWCADPYGWHREEQSRVPAQQVDHIVPLRLNIALAYVRSNLQGLCTRCHARKTRDGG